MPRPKRRRRICGLPETAEFLPAGGSTEPGETVIMTVEEYETVRLIDHEGLTQEQCAGYMQVARTTVQQIYTEARKKLSRMLVEGRPLRIQGGDYRLCEGDNPCCGRGRCRRGCRRTDTEN